MKSKHAYYQRLKDKIDAPLRDIEIRAMWDGLSFTDMKYIEKVNIISEKYFVSDKVVEHALNEIPKTQQI